MTWTKDIKSMGDTLSGSRLDYAWASFKADPAFCKEVAKNPNLTLDMRTHLTAHPDGAVREAFAKRGDLTADETDNALMDKSSQVAAAWMNNHTMDVATLEALHGRGRAAVLDVILRNISRLPILEADPIVLADCLRRSFAVKAVPSGDTMWSLRVLLKDAPEDYLGRVAEHMSDLAFSNVQVAEIVGPALVGREDLFTPGVLNLLLAILETTEQRSAVRILGQMESEGRAKPLGNATITRSQAQTLSRVLERVPEGRGKYSFLASLSDKALGRKGTDLWAEAGNQSNSIAQRAQALAALVEEGHSVSELVKTVPDFNSGLAQQTAELLDVENAREIMVWLMDTQIKETGSAFSRGVHYLGWFLSAASRDDDADLSIAREVIARLPEPVPADWANMHVADRLVPVVPLRLMKSTYHWALRALPNNVYEYLLDQAQKLVEEGYDRASVDVLLDGLLTTHYGSAADLIHVLRDTLGPAPVQVVEAAQEGESVRVIKVAGAAGGANHTR